MGKAEREYPVCYIKRPRVGTDGEGIRVLVILEGCPLKCRYCINRYTWDGTWNSELMNVGQINDAIMKDRIYILSTLGGVTFGGGEPLLYPDLIADFREITDPLFTIYVETSLNVPWEAVEKTLDAVNCYIVDIKSMDKRVYKDYTGGGILEVTKGNLIRLLKEKGTDSIIVRVPYIEGYGYMGCCSDKDSEESLRRLGVTRIDHLRYSRVFEDGDLRMGVI